MVRTPKSSKKTIGRNILDRNMNQYLCCAAEFLEMTEDYGEENLIDQIETYLNEVVVLSLKMSVQVLFACETLLPIAEELFNYGGIIAIQDVHRHMYMTVEGLESKYSLVGTIHYSLVGDRALFKIIYVEGWQRG